MSQWVDITADDLDQQWSDLPAEELSSISFDFAPESMETAGYDASGGWTDISSADLADDVDREGSRWDYGVEQSKSMISAAGEWLNENILGNIPDANPETIRENQDSLRSFRKEVQAKAKEEMDRLPVDVQMNLQRDFDTLDPEGAWRNPSAIWDQMVVQAPNFVIGSVPSIAAMALGPVVGAVVGGVAGGAMSLGDAASQISQEIEAIPESKLKAQSSRYRELLDVMDPESARSQLVTEARRWTSLAAAGLGAAGGGAFGYLGGKMMPGKSRFGRALAAGTTEPAGEFVEEGGTQGASNLGVKLYADPSRDPWEGVLNAGLMGAATSMGPSAAMGSVTPYVPTEREKQGFLNESARLLQERIRAEQQTALADMEVATTAEQVVSAAERMVEAPLDTFELDQFHQSLAAQGLNRQAEIDSLDFSEGPFVNTRLWKETYPSGGTSPELQTAFEEYEALSDTAKAQIPEPQGFRDWKKAMAQVADQEVAGSVKAEEDTNRIFQFLEKDVGAILDNEEVGPEVRNDQLKSALETAKTALRETQTATPGPTHAQAEKSPPATAPAVTIYGSGANGRADFAAQQKAGMRSGVEAPRVTGPMVEEVAKSPDPVFVDSGAFGAFRRGEAVDFDKVYQTYEAIDAKSEAPNMRFVVPDVVGDQDATLSLQRQYADRTKKLIARGHEALVPVQKGKLKPRQAAEQAFRIFGNEVTLAVPANESAFTEGDLRDLMRARPKKIHFLGVAANKTKLDKFTRIVRAFVPDAEISADGNRIRAVTDKKFAQEAAVRKDDAAKDGISQGAGPAAQFDETEGIADFLDNPDSVNATALKAFVEKLSPILPPGTTAASLMKAEKSQPGAFRKAIEEADEDGLYTRDAYFEAVLPAAQKASAGAVRQEMVAEKLKAKPVFKRSSKPLEQIRVTTQATVAETNETVEISQRADLALQEIDNRIGALRALLECAA